MLTYVLKLIAQKNDSIQTINFAMSKLNVLINEYISEQPDIIHYEFEPNTSTSEKYVFCEYPYIRFFLPPFQTQISYNEIFKRITDTYTTEEIIQTVIHLICDELKDTL